jgi:hypothetical protein
MSDISKYEREIIADKVFFSFENCENTLMSVPDIMNVIHCAYYLKYKGFKIVFYKPILKFEEFLLEGNFIKFFEYTIDLDLNNFEWTKSKYPHVNTFITKVYPIAKDLEHKYLISHLVMMAQAALETGWGRNEMSNSKWNIYFNIKVKKGENPKKVYVLPDALEYDKNGKPYKDNEHNTFVAFDTIYESFEHYCKFILSNNKYKYCTGFNYKTVANNLQNAGYATDPNYAEKLIKIIETHFIT